MPLDPRIILGAKPPQIQSPFELRAQMAQFEQADSQNMLARLKMREYQDGVTKKNRIAELRRGSVTETPTYGEYQADNPFGEDLGRMKTQTGTNRLFDQTKYRNSLYGEGFVDEGMAFDDNQRKQEVAAAELANKKMTGKKTGIEVSALQREQAVTKLSAHINDPNLSRESVIADLQSQLDSGELDAHQANSMVSRLPSDPQQLREFLNNTLMSVMKPKDQLEYTTPSANARLSAETSMRGHDVSTNNAVMSDRRAREEGAANRENAVARQRMVATQGNRPPSGYRYKTNGELEAIPGGPGARAEKELKEGQAKALAYAARMQNSDRIINELSANGKNFSTPGSRAGFGIGAVVNTLNTEGGQKLDQAKRDFINAVLRRESGAVISDSEFDNAEKQYFPQIGDADSVVKQKAQNRQVSLKGMKADVPSVNQDQLNEVAGAGPSSPKFDSGNTVKTPDGKTLTFPDAKAAAAFKKAAGL